MSEQIKLQKKPSKKEFEKVMDARFSPQIYEKLKKSRVAVAGLGGIGSHIAVMLARTGIGHLCLVDFDVVDISNLNRQAYGYEHLGMKKTDALKEIILGINPYLEIETKSMKVTEENAAMLFGQYNYVCEAFDRADQKAMLVNTVLENCQTTTIIACSGMAGYGSSNQIVSKKVMNRLYVSGDFTTDIGEGIGIMAPRVTICAGHQANTVVRLILGLNGG